MSTSLSIFEQQIPDFLRTAEVDPLTKALAGGTGNKRISIRGNVFRMVVNGEEIKKSPNRELQIIVANAATKVSRTFYEGTYNADAAVPPTCWSTDGVTPDASVEEPVSSNCAGCPNNIKGSGQGDSRACRFSQRLAVQVVGDPTGDVYQLTLPAQSLFGKGEGDNMPFQQYCKLLAANGRSINTMVTEMYFDTDSATPKLFFRPVAHVTQEQYESAVEAGQSEEAKRAIVMTVAQSDGVKKIAGPAPVKAAAKPAPKAEPEGDEEPEPVAKKKAAKPAVAEGKKNLADVMDQWG